ncbi:ABC transporter permease [Archangium lansingense]|uniref:FtsX-like permease family protein n=1 Tax=Archangium lansingense TaxID=2995310 RepID=A0ABT4A4N8_9BACT|nr:FtsX-like permease family protein [Archangium lansinium]MCY1076219.1 FtsX-like permease family protein [Archangium lansinium]
MGQLKLLVQVAFRNLFASWINVIVGAIILFGTLLVVVGGAVVDSLDASMSRSIIGSVAGHIQVYSEKSKDSLALYGNMGGEADLRVIEKFSDIKKVLEQHPNVKTVVPMGTNSTMLMSGNTVDLTLARLRDLYKQAAPGETPELRAQIDSLKSHVRQMIALLEKDLERRNALAAENAMDPADLQALERARSPEFWEDFEKDALTSLEFLENRIAPLVTDGDMVPLRYLGTDLVNFQKTFDRMRIVDGTAVPEGQRGLLLSKYTYEEFFKMKAARRLDIIQEARAINHKKIAEDPDLQRRLKENQTQTREILFQLDPLKTEQAIARLQKVLGSDEKDLEKLLVSFFTMDDANFDTRYQQFYSELAPLLNLYRIRLGNELPITAFTRTGYSRSANVKVYGTYEFSGMEKSQLAGSINLVDLITFRELYGYMTADQKDELAKLQAASGVTEVKRDNLDDALFGDDSSLVAETTSGTIDEDAQLEGASQARHQLELALRKYTQQDIDDGVVLHAAVMLKDPDTLEQTIVELQESAKKAGLPLKVISWHQASDLVGQIILVAKLVLYAAVFIIFVVAVVIINNSVMMATLQRVREIGTMRAIGAQRGFVLGMVLLETMVLGLVFGAVGALLGTLAVQGLGSAGIPAFHESMYFFFSGPRLFPTLQASNIVTALVIVIGVSAFSTLYPAFLATRVSPIQAMQTDE